jgi:hypothetical protein
MAKLAVTWLLYESASHTHHLPSPSCYTSAGFNADRITKQIEREGAKKNCARPVKRDEREGRRELPNYQKEGKKKLRQVSRARSRCRRDAGQTTASKTVFSLRRARHCIGDPPPLRRGGGGGSAPGSRASRVVAYVRICAARDVMTRGARNAPGLEENSELGFRVRKRTLAYTHCALIATHSFIRTDDVVVVFSNLEHSPPPHHHQ